MSKFGLTPAAIYGAKSPGEKSLADDAIVASWLKHWSQPPTRAEYALNVKTAIESWPEALRALSFKSSGFQLTSDQRDWLAIIAGECSPHSGKTESEAQALFAEITRHPMFTEIAERCEVEIAQFSEAPFFKFGTRAPKDSPYFADFNGRTPSGGAVICNIATSWRAFEDLSISQVQAGHAPFKKGLAKILIGKKLASEREQMIDHLPWMWFREYARWEPYQEFRCFMKDRQFVGATQYYGVDPNVGPPAVYPDLVERGPNYEAAIRLFFIRKFMPATKDYLQGCVFDVIVDLDSDDPDKIVRLVEINPARPTTFPGLKDWNRPETFNGELDWLADLVPQIVVSPKGISRR